MRKVINTAIVALIAGLLGCEDVTTDHVSFITTYPVITLNSPALIIQAKGVAFVDPAEAKVGDQTVPLKIDGAVDETKPGLYLITYTATNKDGFGRSTSRQVVVYDPATDATDLTGAYLRAATGVTVNVVKVSPSTYHIDDAAGFGSSFLDVIFVNTQGTDLIIPQQVAPSSGITVASAPGTGHITSTGFTWVLNASAVYGTSVRTFTKI